MKYKLGVQTVEAVYDNSGSQNPLIEALPECLGQEQFENFTRKVGRQVKRYVQYDYRHTDGELFSCVRPTLDACRAARDAWLDAKAGAMA